MLAVARVVLWKRTSHGWLKLQGRAASIEASFHSGQTMFSQRHVTHCCPKRLYSLVYMVKFLYFAPSNVRETNTFTADILTYHRRKSSGVTNKMNKVSSLFKCPSKVWVVIRSHCSLNCVPTGCICRKTSDMLSISKAWHSAGFTCFNHGWHAQCIYRMCVWCVDL